MKKPQKNKAAVLPKNNSLNNIRHESQRNQMILIITFTVLLSIVGTVINVIANDNALDENLHNTAELISRLYVSAQTMSQEDLTEYFDSVRADLSEIDVISIVDSEGIRKYHSNHNLIGTSYDGTLPVFDLHKTGFYTENDIGPSGPQRRAYCEIYDLNGRYLGFIMTIILKTSIRTVTRRTITLFTIITLIAIGIEFGISRTFSRRLKQKLLGYEPDTFTSMFRIRNNILESINDGIVAVDKNCQVQFLNKSAKNLLKCNEEDEKLNLIHQNVFIQKFMAQALQEGNSSYNLQERTSDGTELLIDCIPIRENQGQERDEISGAVAILHDRTEFTKLMEDLSGTKYLVDSMRANNHDFTNKLHVILGLIQIGQYEQAVNYIENISIIQRETISTIMKSVDNPSLAALLIGKIARASECNVKFILREGSCYKNADLNFPSEALITITGNLIENALDAMNVNSWGNYISGADNEKNSQGENSVCELVFGVFTKPGSLLITVDDTGGGIKEEIRDKIFENGFSTKGTGRGIGLYYTKQLVESLGGNISFETQTGVGTSFMVSFKR